MTRREERTTPGVSGMIEGLDVAVLRDAIQAECAQVAADPAQRSHFHTGCRLTRLLGDADTWLHGVPEESIACFAGTGNPFSLGVLGTGRRSLTLGAAPASIP
jgi:hypothetical protein